jgi:hypothetical protein
MANKIKKRDDKFVRVSNNFIRDKRISFKAKGLFCYMFSMDNDWNFTMKSIATQQGDGLASITSAMNELKEFGYIVYTKHFDGTGTYYLDDEPKPENPYMDNTIVVKRDAIKKTNSTKKTNTKNISLLDEYLQEDTTITEQGTEIVKDFIDYRKKIKSPIKTIQPIKAYMKVLRELIHKGYDYKEVIDLQKEREWQTVKSEWVEKSLKPKGKSDVFASSRNIGGYTA